MSDLIFVQVASAFQRWITLLALGAAVGWAAGAWWSVGFFAGCIGFLQLMDLLESRNARIKR